MLCNIPACGTLAVTLDVVDLFCGKAAVHRATAAQGFTSIRIDRFRIRGITDTGDKHLTEDMSTTDGFHAGIATCAPLEGRRYSRHGSTLFLLRDVERSKQQAKAQ